MLDSRQYTTLAFCAFKNHLHCFKLIFTHGREVNANKGQNQEALKKWADTPTDEKFLAVHFASYHGNFEMVRVLVEQLQCDYSSKNIYGASVLHCAA